MTLGDLYPDVRLYSEVEPFFGWLRVDCEMVWKG